LEETKKKRDVCRQNKWTFVLRGKVIVIRDLAEKIINWLDKFKEIGSMIVQFDPVHAALPWAGVLFLLQVAHSPLSQTLRVHAYWR
jgi:predicted nicotinamide N-methyase